ncbi:hypothetical protein P0082_07715 [Candidatus Haliotispira prima]|uniref:DUF2313 domain-containing protein n=1 Tax=Candidatus Haliotispira prima TaxID=3034016 RepID=A0ABY8MEF6_9SPIO|nr:hypothetical protein P0082_07715 [Candidatus Haliotispira prima]
MSTEFERIYSAANYREALVGLLPRGPFWEALLADESGDLNAWLDWRSAKVKAENDHISSELREGYPWLSEATIRRWETLAGIDPGTETVPDRLEALRDWRSGGPATFSTFGRRIAAAGMRLIRVEQAHRPFTLGVNINAPLHNRKDSHIRRFVVDPQAVAVRPEGYKSGFTIHNTLNKPLFRANDWVFYVPKAPDVVTRIQKITPLPYVAELCYMR